VRSEDLNLRRVVPLTALLAPAAALAQEEGPRTVEVANPMGAHTPFIIFAVGALLLWAISYVLELQREAVGRNKGRQDLLGTKERLLDRMAELESAYEAGSIPEPRYRKQRRDLRRQLSSTLERLGRRGK
jgi:hypothetical protein